MRYTVCRMTTLDAAPLLFSVHASYIAQYTQMAKHSVYHVLRAFYKNGQNNHKCDLQNSPLLGFHDTCVWNTVNPHLCVRRTSLFVSAERRAHHTARRTNASSILGFLTNTPCCQFCIGLLIVYVSWVLLMMALLLAALLGWLFG